MQPITPTRITAPTALKVFEGTIPLAPSWDDPAATAHIEEVWLGDRPFVLFGIEEEGSNNIDPARLYFPDEARRIAASLAAMADRVETTTAPEVTR